MKKIWAIGIKDIKLLLRDRTGFFFTFFFPLFFAIFFGFIFGGGDDSFSPIKVDVVDQDQTPYSRAFFQELQAAPELEVTLADSATAFKHVIKGKRVAYVLIKKGYGQSRENVFAGSPPVVELGVDPSRKAEAAMLQGILFNYAAKDLQKAFTDFRQMKKQADRALTAIQHSSKLPPEQKQRLSKFFKGLQNLFSDTELAKSSMQQNGSAFKGFQPLTILTKEVSSTDKISINGFALSFPQGIVWGILACIISFAISLVQERTQGTLIRMQVAKLRKSTLLMGKALASFLVSFGLSFLLILLGYFVFNMPVGSWSKLIVSLIVISIGFVGIMVLFSVLGKTDRAVSGISWALVLPMTMLGGGMVPLMFLPSWMQTLGNLSPVKWALLVMEGSIWRQFSWEALFFPMAVLLLIGVVSFAIGAWRFRWEN